MKRPRSALQQRQIDAAERVAIIERDLSAGKRRSTRRLAIDVEHLVTRLCALYPERLVRDPTSRHFAFKTRNTGKITLAVASWLYRRYPVGRHLESVWLESAVAHPETTGATRQMPRRPRGEVSSRRSRWRRMATAAS